MDVNEWRARSVEPLTDCTLAELKKFHSVWALNKEEKAELQYLRQKLRKTLMKIPRAERMEQWRDEDEEKKLGAAMMPEKLLRCNLEAKVGLSPENTRTPLFNLTRDIVRKRLVEEEHTSELEAQCRAQRQKKRAERQFTRERGRKGKPQDVVDPFKDMNICKTETLSSSREEELLLERGRLRDKLRAVKQRLRESKKKIQRQIQWIRACLPSFQHSHYSRRLTCRSEGSAKFSYTCQLNMLS
ncbi:hypothetical protein MHYP_G00276560 [Metynnis hypsauchen]